MCNTDCSGWEISVHQLDLVAVCMQVISTDGGQDARARAFKEPFGTNVSHWDASSRLSGDWATAPDEESGIDSNLLAAIAELRVAPGDEAEPEAPEAPYEHFVPRLSMEFPVSLSVDGSQSPANPHRQPQSRKA